MNREDAKVVLAFMEDKTKNEDEQDALLMAIDALSVDGDLIRRQDAIEAVKKRLYETAMNNMEDGDIYADIAEYRIDIWLSEIPSAEAVQRWIPCSERLPDVDVEVLVTVDWPDVLITWVKKGGAWETEEYILDNDEILAWMPLPEPYKKGDNDEE